MHYKVGSLIRYISHREIRLVEVTDVFYEDGENGFDGKVLDSTVKAMRGKMVWGWDRQIIAVLTN